jgi:hypothetical protein
LLDADIEQASAPGGLSTLSTKLVPTAVTCLDGFPGAIAHAEPPAKL